ncbi:predicted protein [Arabidopsis lyrata subsp. lyrata]|uniref:Predicted protein n=1 Tax=Arabidopsis lyrata subsp. lyrata TaxID=81972 RepID=D7LBG8_ARALL|nr:predicted protein [Arabidopsis lyrata subsp. lyrata]
MFARDRRREARNTVVELTSKAKLLGSMSHLSSLRLKPPHTLLLPLQTKQVP